MLPHHLEIKTEEEREPPLPPSAAPDVAASLPITIIDARHNWLGENLRAVWEYRELLFLLVWRDVAVRYKQTVLGIGWAVLQPLLTMVVFSAVFGSFAKIPSDGVPYPVFAYTALLPWSYFSGALTRSGNSLVGNANLISKVFFPRLLVPLAAALAGLVDFAVAFVILLGLMVFYGIRPTATLWALPLFLLLAFATALGAGLWLSALNVKYRDVGYLLPFIVQIWMYASPVAYPSSIVPDRFRVLFGLNPMAGVIEGFRAALLGTRTLDWSLLAASLLIVAVLLFTGALYFNRSEEMFADVV